MLDYLAGTVNLLRFVQRRPYADGQAQSRYSSESCNRGSCHFRVKGWISMLALRSSVGWLTVPLNRQTDRRRPWSLRAFGYDGGMVHPLRKEGWQKPTRRPYPSGATSLSISCRGAVPRPFEG